MRLFVRNLQFKINDAKLKSLFSPFGGVESAKVIMDKESGRSKGFGFIEMPNDEEAMNAIKGLNKTEVEGREIEVKEAEIKSGNYEVLLRYGIS